MENEKTSLDEKGHLTRTQLYYVTGILSICVLGLCGYILFDEFLREDDASDGQPIVTDTSDETGNEVPDLEEDATTITYTNDSSMWGIEFDYPEEYSVVEVENEIQVTIDLRYEDMEMNTTLLAFQKVLRPLTYDDGPRERDTSEIDPVIIDGNSYSFDKYILGEGSFGWGNSITTYVATISDDLYALIYDYEEFQKTYCDDTDEDCSGFVQETIYDYRTPERDLENAMIILESLRFVE